MSAQPRSRVFRQIVCIEVVAIVPPDVELAEQNQDSGLLAGLDAEAEVRGAILSMDTGSIWLTAGEATATPPEELKPMSAPLLPTLSDHAARPLSVTPATTSREAGSMTDRPTFGSVQVAMSKTLEDLQTLQPGSLSDEHASLLRLYLRQMTEALAGASRR